ncbi:MAG: hypothetical protein JNL03_13420 [Prolixibacteraceae bacterium]|nr:hypothetical protein [Prolixibacteraceae bacterium]
MKSIPLGGDKRQIDVFFFRHFFRHCRRIACSLSLFARPCERSEAICRSKGLLQSFLLRNDAPNEGILAFKGTRCLKARAKDNPANKQPHQSAPYPLPSASADGHLQEQIRK